MSLLLPTRPIAAGLRGSLPLPAGVRVAPRPHAAGGFPLLAR